MANASFKPENQQRMDEAATQTSEAARLAGERSAAAIEEGVRRALDLSNRATEGAQHVLQKSTETAAKATREATARISNTLGFSSDEAGELSQRAKQNMDAIGQCNRVLTQSVQDASKRCIELGQSQIQRHMDGLQKLAQVKTVQEFAAVQTDLIRESLESLVTDNRTIFEQAIQAFEAAGKSFTTIK